MYTVNCGVVAEEATVRQDACPDALDLCTRGEARRRTGLNGQRLGRPGRVALEARLCLTRLECESSTQGWPLLASTAFRDRMLGNLTATAARMRHTWFEEPPHPTTLFESASGGRTARFLASRRSWTSGR